MTDEELIKQVRISASQVPKEVSAGHKAYAKSFVDDMVKGIKAADKENLDGEDR